MVPDGLGVDRHWTHDSSRMGRGRLSLRLARWQAWSCGFGFRAPLRGLPHPLGRPAAEGHQTAEACELMLELPGVEKEAPTCGAKTATSKPSLTTRWRLDLARVS